MNDPDKMERDEVEEFLEDLEGTQEIRAEIEHTRVEMSGTIDAIQDKLNPDVLADQARDKAQEVAALAAERAREQVKETVRDATEQIKETVYEATVGRAEQMVSDARHTARGVPMTMMETIKQNPVPAAVAALSLGWLWMHRPRGAATAQTYGYGSGTAPYYGSSDGYGTGPTDSRALGQSGAGQVADRVGQTVGQAKDAAGQALNTAGQTVGDVASGAGYLASSVAGGAGQMAGNVASGAGQVAGTAGETAADLGSSMLDTISRNPLPAALTGIGLAWLWMNRSSEERRPHYAHSGAHAWQGNASYASGYGNRSGPQAVAGQAQDAAGQVAEQAQGAADQVAERVQGAAGQVAGRVADTAGQVADTAGQLVGEGQYRARRAGGRLQQMMDENPLLVGTVATAAGLAVGLVTPSTERENELMGRAREEFVRHAQDTAQETLEKVQQVAGDTGDAARKAAAEQKLTV